MILAMKHFFLLIALALPSFGNILTVTNNADTGAGSLRSAVSSAVAGDTITFGGAVFTGPETAVSVRLTSGEIFLNKDLTINGITNIDGSNKVVITGDKDASDSYTAGDSNAFEISGSVAGSKVTLNHLSFMRCGDTSSGGAVNVLNGSSVSVVISGCRFTSNHSEASGGAFYSNTVVPIEISNCNFESNTALSSGAVQIANSTNLNISDSMFVTNQATLSTGYSGALNVSRCGALALTNSSFTGNSSLRTGGACRIDYTPTTIRGCTFDSNSSIGGGAIHFFSSAADPIMAVAVSNCTFAANTAAEASAMSISGNVSVDSRHDTISKNSTTTINPTSGGAVTCYDGSIVTFTSCIIAGNIDTRATGTKYPDVYFHTLAIPSSGGGNVIGDAAGSGTVFSGAADADGTTASPLNPGLFPLADYGGATATFALYPLSPAINFAPAASESTDQRGQPRTSGNTADAGSFELQVASYLSWAAERLSTFPANQRQKGDDPDGDGIPNVIEYLQGSAPGIINPPIERVETESNSIYYSFSVSNDANLDDVDASVAESPDLVAWTYKALKGNAVGAVYQSGNANRSRYRSRSIPLTGCATSAGSSLAFQSENPRQWRRGL